MFQSFFAFVKSWFSLYPAPPVIESRIEDVGKTKLFILFKDGALLIKEFKGGFYDIPNFTEYLISSKHKADKYISDISKLGFIEKSTNILAPISEITQIDVIHESYQILIETTNGEVRVSEANNP